MGILEWRVYENLGGKIEEETVNEEEGVADCGWEVLED